MEVLYKNVRDMLEKRTKESKDKVYLAFYERELTFSELNKQTNKFANGLLNLGIKKGDIVYVYLNNCPEHLISTLAANKIGAVAGPINTWLKAEEIKYQLNDSKGKIIVTEPEFIPVMEKIKPDLKYLQKIIEIGDKPKEGNLSFKEIMEKNSEELKEIEIKKDDLSFIFYTAGTTGNPKGALLTHGNVVFELAGIREALKAEEAKGDETLLIFLPMFHVNAMMSMLSGIYRGIKIALLKKFSVREFGPTVEKHKCTFFSAVPKVYKILIEAKDTVQKYNLSSFKFGICGAAPMPVETIKQFEALYGIEILEGYGLTEGTVASTLHRRGQKKKIGSIGPALPGQDVRIFDENDQELPTGQVGEIVVKGDNVMVGYLGLEEENKKTLRGGWLHTGDVGYVDEEGYFYIVDREKDMIIKGGENIYPKEIENVISGHPAVHDVAVIGVPDELSGEEVKAFVVPRLGKEVSEEEIINFCKEKLADFKVPKYVEFVAGIPASAIGKALKKLLRKGEGITKLSEIISEETLNLEVIFQMIPYRFNKEKAGKWQAAIQYEIYGKNSGVWTLNIKEGSLEVIKGKVENPTAVVKMYDQVFKKIISKEIDGVSAINSGLMQIEGQEADVAMLSEVMG